MLIGIDEVGRGPLAGPLLVGAVCLAEPVEGLADSKTLSAVRREQLAAEIMASRALIGLGWVYIEELNRIGLSAGLKLATLRAVEELLSRASERGGRLALFTTTGVSADETEIASERPLRAGSPDGDSGCTAPLVAPSTTSASPSADKHLIPRIIIDGTVNFLANTVYGSQVSVLKKADQLVAEVSAASIVAKVARDRYMTELAARYPAYGFAQHMGYGTAAHLQAISEQGICPEHRLFCRPCAKVAGLTEAVRPNRLSSNQTTSKNTTAVGNRAEQRVTKHLIQHGHQILARNFKTKIAELDIVSQWRGEIFVTEVKYRRDNRAGGGLAAISTEKIRHLRRGAEQFLQQTGLTGKNVRLLAAAVGPRSAEIIFAEIS